MNFEDIPYADVALKNAVENSPADPYVSEVLSKINEAIKSGKTSVVVSLDGFSSDASRDDCIKRIAGKGYSILTTAEENMIRISWGPGYKFCAADSVKKAVFG